MVSEVRNTGVASTSPLALLLGEGGAADCVHLYMREIGQYPLLSQDEETALAKAVAEGHAAALELASADPPPDRRAALEGQLITGQAARDRLVEANLRLVASIAKKYAGRGLPYMDLIQEGNLGLAHAVHKFDYRKGYRFSTYATWWIRQAISRALADHSRTIRVPVHILEVVSKVTRVARELQQDLGREPLPEEIGEVLDLPGGKVRSALGALRQPVSLETPLGEKQDSVLSDYVADTASPSPFDAVSWRLLSEEVGEVLADLDPRSRLILDLRFGLSDGRPRTLAEVGAELGLTRERVRQLEASALDQLRHPRVSRRLKAYLD